MKKLLSILLTVFSLLFGLLLVMNLTVFNQGFLDTQFAKSSQTQELTDKISNSITHQLPMDLSDTQKKELNEALFPLAQATQESISYALYYPGTLDQKITKLAEDCTGALAEILEQNNIPFQADIASYMSPVIEQYLTNYFESTNLKYLEQAASWIDTFKLPVLIGCIATGILSLLCLIGLFALRSTGGGLAFLISGLLLLAIGIFLWAYPSPFNVTVMQTYQTSTSYLTMIVGGGAIVLAALSQWIGSRLRRKSQAPH